MREHPPTTIDPTLAETVNRLYVRPVDLERARGDVATIAEAARLADQTRGPRVSAGGASHARRRRTPLWRPALAAAAALVAIPGGMAAAGVQIPEPFDAPYRAVGVALPNQDEQARDEQPSRTTRRRSTQTPAATTPPRTSTPATTPAAPAATREERTEPTERRERARRKARAERRRAARGDRRATPAVPAEPARPSGKAGGGATTAEPARPALPAGPQKRSAATRPGRGPQPKTLLPRATPRGKAHGLDRGKVR